MFTYIYNFTIFVLVPALTYKVNEINYLYFEQQKLLQNLIMETRTQIEFLEKTQHDLSVLSVLNQKQIELVEKLQDDILVLNEKNQQILSSIDYPVYSTVVLILVSAVLIGGVAFICYKLNASEEVIVKTIDVVSKQIENTAQSIIKSLSDCVISTATEVATKGQVNDKAIIQHISTSVAKLQRSLDVLYERLFDLQHVTPLEAFHSATPIVQNKFIELLLKVARGFVDFCDKVP